MTPLHTACFVADSKSLGLLLNHKDINVNSLIVNEPSPHSLITEGFTGLCFLLVYNIESDIEYCQYRSLHTQPENITRILGRRRECARILLADPRVDVNQGSAFDRPLSLAVQHDNVIFELLLQRDDIDINLGSNFEDTTALVRAIEHNNMPAFKLLLGDLRLKINRQGIDFGETALHVAVAENNIEMVQLLLQYSLYGLVNICPSWQLLARTFLLCNQQMSVPVNLVVVRTIFSFLCPSIDVNARLNNYAAVNSVFIENLYSGATPLTLAAQQGYLIILNLLLTHPTIDICKKDGNGQTPLQIAQANNHLLCVAALKKQPAF